MTQYTLPDDAIPFTEGVEWEDAIYIAPESAYAVAGVYTVPSNLDSSGFPVGNINLPVQQLAKRTAYLKGILDAFSRNGHAWASSDYIVLPGGLIIQYGSGVSAPEAVTAVFTGVTFPLAFPNAVYAVIGSAHGSANSSLVGGWPAFCANNITETGFSAVLDTLAYTTFSDSVPFTWVAIGT